VTRKIGCSLCFLGVQDAGRKRTEASQDLGERAGAGAMAKTANDQTSVLVSISKWKKGKGILVRVCEKLGTRGCLNYKQLERYQGFLIYVSRTYRNMSPYLKGIHQTLESWREGRDKESWKLERREIMLFLISREGSS